MVTIINSFAVKAVKQSLIIETMLTVEVYCVKVTHVDFIALYITSPDHLLMTPNVIFKKCLPIIVEVFSLCHYVVRKY